MSKSVFILINAKQIWCGGRQPASSCRSPSEGETRANALYAIGNRIACLGSTDQILASAAATLNCDVDALLSSEVHRAPHVTLIDAQNRYFAVPGFIDAHVHLLDGGRRLFSPNLRHCKSRSEFVAALKLYIADNHIPPGQWIAGGDWSDVLLGEPPTRHWVDEATTEHPCLLARMDSHCAVVNSMVLDQCAEICAADAVVEGGTVVREESGFPTGLLKEKAATYVKKKLWPLTDDPERMKRALEIGAEYLVSHGITFVHSMSSLDYGNLSEIQFLADYEKQHGRLPIRCRTAIRAHEIGDLLRDFVTMAPATSEGAMTKVPPVNTLLPSGFLRIGAVKFFSDGSLGSRTAAMKEPYEGTCECGYMLQSEDELLTGIREAVQNGLQCCIHAIGDAAVSTSIRCLTRASLECGSDSRALRHRIEHCQHIDPHDGTLETMQQYGIIASCQPCHLLFDGDYVTESIGATRKGHSYMFRSMLDHGVRLCFGSDWMVAPASVIDGLRAATCRVPDAVRPEARTVWTPSERVTLRQALAAFTSEGAYAAFAEDEVGVLAPGYLADIAVLSEDLLEGEALLLPDGGTPTDDRLARCKVVLTVLDGQVVFDAR